MFKTVRGLQGYVNDGGYCSFLPTVWDLPYQSPSIKTMANLSINKSQYRLTDTFNLIPVKTPVTTNT